MSLSDVYNELYQVSDVEKTAGSKEPITDMDKIAALGAAGLIDNNTTTGQVVDMLEAMDKAAESKDILDVDKIAALANAGYIDDNTSTGQIIDMLEAMDKAAEEAEASKKVLQQNKSIDTRALAAAGVQTAAADKLLVKQVAAAAAAKNAE